MNDTGNRARKTSGNQDRTVCVGLKTCISPGCLETTETEVLETEQGFQGHKSKEPDYASIG